MSDLSDRADCGTPLSLSLVNFHSYTSKGKTAHLTTPHITSRFPHPRPAYSQPPPLISEIRSARSVRTGEISRPACLLLRRKGKGRELGWVRERDEGRREAVERENRWTDGSVMMICAQRCMQHPSLCACLRVPPLPFSLSLAHIPYHHRHLNPDSLSHVRSRSAPLMLCLLQMHHTHTDMPRERS